MARLLSLLTAAGASLATAESLTGGQLSAAITSVAGASAVYRGGVVSYATEVKTELLGVPEQLIATDGVVSAACARAMAQGARRALHATYSLSTTGVAGPDLQEGKPVGTVFVGISGPGLDRVLELSLAGDRTAVQRATWEAAVDALIRMLQEEEPSLR